MLRIKFYPKHKLNKLNWIKLKIFPNPATQTELVSSSFAKLCLCTQEERGIMW